ncbi:hypothetical protein [Pelagibacterium montanilacus]|uniref:hypothetical protein n=1 Tax=Pelagibacterium montanilacus TaxID=2185280 RepID=UPI000F8F5A4B|nr:hypothetical protein [Pelagibacterium montanilacus]
MTANHPPPATRPSYFDSLAGEDARDPLRAARAELDMLALMLEADRRWVCTSAGDRVAEITDLTRPDADSLAARITMTGTSLALSAQVDGSGWIAITARLGDREVFIGWLDRPYEEREIWPAGGQVERRADTDPPGRVGKRLNWITLDADFWPGIGALADGHGFVGFHEETSYRTNPPIEVGQPG